MLAAFATFVFGYGISFFLSPFIVSHLGRAAYGFVGLSNNIVGYTSLLTVALNAMAGRFISLSYMKGDKKAANEYFSSVFFSNILLSAIIAVMAVFFVVFINRILAVPDDLLSDVRLLFSLLVANTIIGLVTNMFGLGTFIANRLDLSSVRGIIGSVINAVFLLCAFLIFDPHVWYLGLAGLVGTVYTSYANWILKRRLTPDLRINIRCFQWGKVVELIKSGVWNVVGKLSDIFKNGLDLLYANVFVGAALMGTLSLSKAVASITLSVFGAISGTFSPELTSIYASGDIDLLTHELKKTIRIMSCLSTPILCSLYTLSGDFFHMWLPTEDSNQLYALSLLGTVSYILTLPLEGLWNIFTLTNKLKYSSLTLLCESLTIFCLVLVSMHFVTDKNVRIMLIAFISPMCGMIRNATFLPMYGAHCLHKKLSTFYPTILHSLLSLGISALACFFIKRFLSIDSWLMLIIAGCLVAAVGFATSYFIVLTSPDRMFFRRVACNAVGKVKSVF